jgi:hypothetical protein
MAAHYPAKGSATLRIYLGVEQALPHLCDFAYSSIPTAAKASRRSRWSMSTYEGGQATPHALTHAQGATMPGADAPRQPMPVACDEKPSLSDARRAVAGRTER